MSDTPSLPPIVRSGFAFQWAFLAEVGHMRRHTRASVAELTTLLRPDAKTRKKEENRKDQVWHWWEAQLKHYGLPQTRDKNVAKVRLLDALNRGKLKVPESVARLEDEMKKEWAKLVRKERTRAGEDTTAKKRKASEGRHVMNDTKTPSVKRTKSSAGKTREMVGRVSRDVDKSWEEDKRRALKEENEPAKVKSEPNSRKRVGKSRELSWDFDRWWEEDGKRALEEREMSNLGSGWNNQNDSGGTDDDDCSEDDNVDTVSDPGIDPENLHPYARVFKLRSECYFSDRDYDVTLRITSNPDCLVGRLENFGPWEGMIKIAPKPDPTSTGSISFGWRVRDTNTGEMRYGRGCFGEIKFFGSEQVRGTFFNMPRSKDTIEFVGVALQTAYPRSNVSRRERYRRAAMAMLCDWDNF
ncbi:hypothetical protein BDY21DRAFT_364873 [Lineolata rhizophorae]|uniref:Uncharacterized protein n=1 Tax=Lineolata rhizophorae TaxID=578093 RepID=A0A6A6NWQ8_9PEZI|nr:hypothetical protein BDY21DRAFT_364873 [Lineolata rhizophorae]